MSSSEAAVRERLVQALRTYDEEIADRWVQLQWEQASVDEGVAEGELRQEADDLLAALQAAVESSTPVSRLVADFPELNRAVVELSMRRARAGASPTSTSLAVLALKEALVDCLRKHSEPGEDLLAIALTVNRLLDAAGALSFETYVEGREEIIRRQSRQLLEVSTPVVRLWDKVLGVPLIGTLDTARTQVVMENLLQAIQESEAVVTIIDITGVPTVDTAVAQHLMHTVNAVRLMGADCVISGIRPQIAQTIAQLGIDLSAILTRATLSDALSTAMGLIDGSRQGTTGAQMSQVGR
ncbi:STAS domain-containing protein [Streptomyces sp. NPDC059740]|uniref:STAS domain-containing protein n=1 Tax=Streptomyces sp. NPDC059740 TaxID=3346926 RepID=UPI0036683383